MSDSLTLHGFVATSPRHLVTSEGLPITSFRLASNQRRFDRSQDKWVDGDTNWYTVTAFRQLAMNTAGSVAKGDRVIVAGRIRIRDWENGERAGTTVDIEADTIGHDLLWGTASFTRSIKASARDDEGEVPDQVSLPDVDAADSEATDSGAAGLQATDSIAADSGAADSGAADSGAADSGRKESPVLASAGVATPF